MLYTNIRQQIILLLFWPVTKETLYLNFKPTLKWKKNLKEICNKNGPFHYPKSNGKLQYFKITPRVLNDKGLIVFFQFYTNKFYENHHILTESIEMG